MMFWLLELAYFMLPAYVANMAPVLSRFVGWNIPLNKNLFGSHKTVVGTLFGLTAAVLMTFIQSEFVGFVYYTDWLLLGLLLGSGALFGDIVKSFVKRKLNIKEGKPWIPFDEIDFSIGALFFVSFVYFPGWVESIVIVVMSALGHIAVNHAAFYLKIRKEKW
ncbi:CDP-archaeol synthase [Candidatus Woesearchaeota archaeon]|nr:CDP-archaeol synthase [Candidatus Woesearchaeota archaeon]